LSFSFLLKKATKRKVRGEGHSRRFLKDVDCIYKDNFSSSCCLQLWNCFLLAAAKKDRKFWGKKKKDNFLNERWLLPTRQSFIKLNKFSKAHQGLVFLFFFSFSRRMKHFIRNQFHSIWF